MKLARFEVGQRAYTAHLGEPVSLAIPLQFDGRQPNFFNAPRAHAAEFRADGFTGSTLQGGTCNVSTLQLTPHCNGTHTECIGHVVNEPVAVAEQLSGALLAATVVTCTPQQGVISDAAIRDAFEHYPLPAWHEAFILRTMPNARDKLSRDYRDAPAWLASTAVARLVQAKVEHLLVDLPSLDATDDRALSAHRIFWGLPRASQRLADARRPQATITEMIYVPDTVADGYYLLDLQIPAFASDAAPSRPIIYPVQPA